MRILFKLTLCCMVAGVAASSMSCKGGQAGAANDQGVTFSPQSMADVIHSVVEGHRNVYTNLVVNRLSNDGIIHASEQWEEEDALLLPAQLFRHSAERVTRDNYNFNYHLRSLWPVNDANKPQSDVEEAGLRFVKDNPSRNYYTEIEENGTRFFIGVYADRAASPVCVSCHNAHPKSPRKNFKMDDVMGGVVVRIPLS